MHLATAGWITCNKIVVGTALVEKTNLPVVGEDMEAIPKSPSATGLSTIRAR
jgi:hypothetical protein